MITHIFTFIISLGFTDGMKKNYWFGTINFLIQENRGNSFFILRYLFMYFIIVSEGEEGVALVFISSFLFNCFVSDWILLMNVPVSLLTVRIYYLLWLLACSTYVVLRFSMLRWNEWKSKLNFFRYALDRRDWF